MANRLYDPRLHLERGRHADHVEYHSHSVGSALYNSLARYGLGLPAPPNAGKDLPPVALMPAYVDQARFALAHGTYGKDETQRPIPAGYQRRLKGIIANHGTDAAAAMKQSVVYGAPECGLGPTLYFRGVRKPAAPVKRPYRRSRQLSAARAPDEGS